MTTFIVIIKNINRVESYTPFCQLIPGASKIRDTKYEIRDTKYEIRNTRYENRRQIMANNYENNYQLKIQ